MYNKLIIGGVKALPIIVLTAQLGQGVHVNRNRVELGEMQQREKVSPRGNIAARVDDVVDVVNVDIDDNDIDDNNVDIKDVVDDDGDADVVNNGDHLALVNGAPQEKINDFSQMRPAVITDVFWTIIESIHWRNMSDGGINARATLAIINKLTELDRRIFKVKYTEFYNMMKNRLDIDDMFTRNGIITQFEIAKIVSHVIALGRDIFTTLFEDLAFFQFLIETGECQSFDSCLPNDL